MSSISSRSPPHSFRRRSSSPRRRQRLTIRLTSWSSWEQQQAKYFTTDRINDRHIFWVSSLKLKQTNLNWHLFYWPPGGDHCGCNKSMRETAHRPDLIKHRHFSLALYHTHSHSNEHIGSNRGLSIWPIVHEPVSVLCMYLEWVHSFKCLFTLTFGTCLLVGYFFTQQLSPSMYSETNLWTRRAWHCDFSSGRKHNCFQYIFIIVSAIKGSQRPLIWHGR